MTRHHLTPEYARAARSYLAAFLGEREAVDAMHEVAADATYWGDDSLADVLAVAHGVLLSRLRVTGEAAASWLVDELGLPADIAAHVTDTEPPIERDERDEEASHVEEPPRVPEPPVEPAPPPEPARPPEPVALVEPVAPVARVESPAPVEPVDESPSLPLRIGFDEDPLPFRIFDDPPGARWRLAAGALLIAGLVLVALLLISR